MVDGVVGFPFDILGVGDAEYFVGTVFFVLSHHFRDCKEQVAGCLDGEAKCVGVDLRRQAVERGGSGGCAAVGLVPCEAGAEDEVVLIAVAQQRVVGSDVVDEIHRGAGQRHNVEVDQVECAAGAVAERGPLEAPCGACDHAGVFGPLLPHERQRELGCGRAAPLEAATQEWRLEFGECDAHLSCQLGVAVVDQPLEISRQAFVGAAELCCEHFAAMEDVAVVPCDAAADTEVTLGVGALQFKLDCLLFGARQQDVDVEILLASRRLRVGCLAGRASDYVDIFQNLQPVEGLVGAVDADVE